MYVKTSSSGPIVTLVTTGAASAAREILYGFWPPVMVIPHGSQVSSVDVTFDLAMGGSVGGGGIHDGSFPAEGSDMVQGR